MGSAQSCKPIHRRALLRRAGLLVTAALILASCHAAGTSKSGGQPDIVSHGTITLTFASADPLPVDTQFATLVREYSGGQLRLRTVLSYDDYATNVDQVVAADLRKGKLDVADVGSRAWDGLGVLPFRAYQEPFLITSRELLDKAVTGSLATGLLGSLKPVGITGLAIIPQSIRYLFSTRPLMTLAQFSGAKIRINDSATTTAILTSLGATPVTNVLTGSPEIQALRDGQLTAVEYDPEHIDGGFVKAAPYVVVNAPLFGKTSTFAVNSKALARLPARDAGWLRRAAAQAAASAASQGVANDRAAWASACGQGLKPLALSTAQFIALHNAEAPTYADLAGDPMTTLAAVRIGSVAMHEPRMDPWATCHGVGVAKVSPTAVLDGSYGVTWTEAEVVASGDCSNCGNAGPYALTVHQGRYALYHPKWIDSSPSQPSVSFDSGWRPDDPVEVGTITVSGNRVTLVPEVNQQFGSTPSVYTFELFRSLLTWHPLTGTGWDSTSPWRKLS